MVLQSGCRYPAHQGVFEATNSAFEDLDPSAGQLQQHSTYSGCVDRNSDRDTVTSAAGFLLSADDGSGLVEVLLDADIAF